jgi:malonyl CoA-acyl carrier protein transacylase
MNCFMFPGQPLSRDASLPGDADFAQIAELVRRVAHLDLESFAWVEGGGTDHLKFQLLGAAQSLYRLRRLRRLGVLPDLVAQHSMGIYSALVACDVLAEEQAIEITWRVGSLLAGMGRTQEYALGCVIGLTLEPVLELADHNSVHLANHNTSRHFLLSGRGADIAKAMVEALDLGAFSARTFSCDAPLHSPLILQLERELREILAEYRYGEPACPLMNHLDQSFLGAADIAGFLLRELSLPVYWERTYRSLRAAGAKNFFEVGTGEALKKFNRWIEGEIEG